MTACSSPLNVPDGVFVVPGVLVGSMFLLWLTGNTLNIQSFMGCIMAVGVAVSNAVLLISNAEQVRLASTDPAGAECSCCEPFATHHHDQPGHDRRNDPDGAGAGEGGSQTSPLALPS